MLSVADESSITSNVLGGTTTVEDWITVRKLEGFDAEDARAYWAEMEAAKAALKPGESLSIPGEWS